MTEITVPLTQANPRRSIVGVSFVSIAWRNLWRNMRRSWLMISSVAFIVLLIVFMHSSQMGIFGTMIDLQANQLHGHAQIQHPKYNDDPRVEYTVPTDWEETGLLIRPCSADWRVMRWLFLSRNLVCLPIRTKGRSKLRLPIL